MGWRRAGLAVDLWRLGHETRAEREVALGGATSSTRRFGKSVASSRPFTGSSPILLDRCTFDPVFVLWKCWYGMGLTQLLRDRGSRRGMEPASSRGLH